MLHVLHNLIHNSITIWYMLQILANGPICRGNDELTPIHTREYLFRVSFRRFYHCSSAECNFANFIGRFRIVKDPLTVTINYSANDS